MSDARAAAVRELAREAADMFLVDVEEVLSKCRGTASITNARQVAYALARHRYGWSYPEIGKAFGRDPSTVMHGIKRAKREWPERIAWKAAAE